MDFELKSSGRIVKNVFWVSDEKFRVKHFFGQFILFISFSKFRQFFLGPLETSLRKGCQKCLVGSQRNVIEKNRYFGKTNFWKKFRTSSGKLSADLKTAFVICNRKCWGKSGSPQRAILFVPTWDSKQKTLGRFVKPLLEASRATFLRKKCFLEETLFILIWELDWKTVGRVVKLASYMTTKRYWSKGCF